LSLPMITREYTAQQIEQALLHNSTIYDDRGGEGIQGIFWHNPANPEQPWTYDYFGYCKDSQRVAHGGECVDWVSEPHRHSFSTFSDMVLYAAFVGLEMS
jgi:hypothetical protein